MYSLNPSPADPNTDLTVTFPSIVTPNQACVALFQDGVQQSCYLDKLVPNGLRCTINSGNPGTHTLQLKYGQSSLYPGVKCGIPTAGNTYTYTTKYQVTYDNLPTDWSAIPEQDYTSDNLRIRHTFSSTPGDKFVFVKFKTNKGREEVHQLKVVLTAVQSPNPTVIPTIVPTAAPTTNPAPSPAGQASQYPAGTPCKTEVACNVGEFTAQ